MATKKAKADSRGEALSGESLPGDTILKDEKKRGHYRRIECPYCHKHVGNLQNHIRLKHPTELKKEGKPIETELTKEDLLGTAKHEEGPAKQRYFCQNCYAKGVVTFVRKDEKTCHVCGETLIWEGIE